MNILNTPKMNGNWKVNINHCGEANHISKASQSHIFFEHQQIIESGFFEAVQDEFGRGPGACSPEYNHPPSHPLTHPPSNKKVLHSLVPPSAIATPFSSTSTQQCLTPIHSSTLPTPKKLGLALVFIAHRLPKNWIYILYSSGSYSSHFTSFTACHHWGSFDKLPPTSISSTMVLSGGSFEVEFSASAVAR